MYWITTARLQLRRWQAADLDAFCALTANPQIMHWVGDGQPLDRETTARWINRANSNADRWGYGTHAVVDAASGTVIGWAGLNHNDYAPEPDVAEIIYALAPSHWGQGLATELAQAMIAWAWHNSGLSAMVATIDPANAASIAMMGKLGFTHVEDAVDEDGLPEARFRLNKP
ncbi:GNAT family N-acetyltransferase [Chitinimonas sp. BJYL2]|uniref:GNAT family N-acetyltransferase n=1 Tax=Chitinimonas sp. BJYL2 TaxID=2976696 RepID=UPI0022B5D348|nr:GNAT family N-acetyltransferase [Chitinimonas sp. BJYL2]